VTQFIHENGDYLEGKEWRVILSSFRI